MDSNSDKSVLSDETKGGSCGAAERGLRGEMGRCQETGPRAEKHQGHCRQRGASARQEASGGPSWSEAGAQLGLGLGWPGAGVRDPALSLLLLLDPLPNVCAPPPHPHHDPGGARRQLPQAPRGFSVQPCGPGPAARPDQRQVGWWEPGFVLRGVGAIRGGEAADGREGRWRCHPSLRGRPWKCIMSSRLRRPEPGRGLHPLHGFSERLFSGEMRAAREGR